MSEGELPLADCGCCQGVTAGTPAPIENRPGLPVLAYRIGTHGTFKATMQAALAGEPGLGALTTRRDDDPSIALIDAWSTVLDVLTFYQERIANEGYLRTATETKSVYELAAEIGYVPNPGVAASTRLAFELETAPGAPGSVQIPVGTRVQSVPGPDEKPQTFETIEAIEARPEWNKLQPQRGVRLVPGMGDQGVYLAGVATGLKPGDALLLVGKEREDDPESERWDFRLATAVEADPDRGVTRIAWEHPLGWRGPGQQQVQPAQVDVRCYALRLRASLFGHNAPDWRSMPPDTQGSFLDTAGQESGVDWPTLSISKMGKQHGATNPANTIFLDASYPKVVPGSWLVLSSPTSSRGVPYVELYQADQVQESSRTDFTLTAKSTEVTLRGEHLDYFDHQVRSTTVFVQSEELTIAEVPVIDPVQGQSVTIETAVEGLQKGRALLVSGKRPAVQVADGVHLNMVTDGGPVELHPRDVLQVVEPFVGAGGLSRRWTLQTEDGRKGTVTAGPTELVPVPVTSEEALAEVAVLRSADPTPGDPSRTTLTLARALKHAFDRGSTTIWANVAPATHGETKKETLGNGNAAVLFQAFTLKGSPLTYVPASTPSGGTTTLGVTVNGVAWTERPALFALGPRDRAYVVRIGGDGKVAVEFGDGREGARLPTGSENVQATYRAGTGTAGNVDAGQLSLLLTRPLGVTRVSNPLAAIGGADPESRDDARVNAPRTVLTFDRVVSVQDYEDFARAFGSIAKAQARWLWDGATRLAHVTVAGTGGDAVTLTAAPGSNLVKAIRDHGDPRQPFQVASYDPLTFDVAAGVFLKRGYDWELVRPAVEAGLRAAFSFDRRDLAQPVTGSEVIAAIQAVAGVLAVDLDTIAFTGQSPPAEPVLLAHAARPDPAGLLPAQLLTLNPVQAGLTLILRT